MSTKIKKSPAQTKNRAGKLRIGDNWNAITIIAFSQNNPLKAIAEFVENSIDAHAKNITIIRGRERGKPYLKVIDDGEGIPLNGEGIPDFKYVATHICDSVKKRLRKEGVEGIQGEFGIGLLSFWTVGEQLILSSAGSDGRAYQMEMKKNEPGYVITPRRQLFSHPGTELIVHPLLSGIRQLNGERIQNYLASELRDRIRKSGVQIKIKDRQSRKEFEVKPRQFNGRLLRDLEVLQTEEGEIYLELYLNSYSPENTVSLSRSGTRVMPSIVTLDFFNREPWTSGYLQGMIDVPFLQLTPGTRDGIILDEHFFVLCRSVETILDDLHKFIEEEKKAEEEEASRNILKSVQRAFREAFLLLPQEEYDWFEIYKLMKKRGGGDTGRLLIREKEADLPMAAPSEGGKEEGLAAQEKNFFEHAGPLYSVIISPASSIMKVNTAKNFRCIPRDRSRRMVEHNISIHWELKEGEGLLSNATNEVTTFTAPAEPGLSILQVTVIQDDTVCRAESVITVTETLMEKEGSEDGIKKGLPGYTFLRAPGELWRSKYDEKNNLIIINNGHSDYLFAAKKKARKLKYICRLFAKELVLQNFPGFTREELLERMIELSLYTEENLH